MRIILDTMELKEVGDIVLERSIAAFEKEIPLINRKTKNYKRIMKNRGNVKTYFKPFTVTNNDITFHFILSCFGYSDLKKNSARVLVLSEFRYQGERFYGMTINNFSQLALYTTHFIERYVERHLKDDSQINVDTFIKFIIETDGVTCGFDEGIDNKIQWVTPIGNTCGCVLNKRVLLHKTFIDKSTIVKGKKKVANDRGNDLEKYTHETSIGFRTLPKMLLKYYNFNLF